MTRSERILSIQSHVVFGYVGGKAAVFPLQCLGYDVDVINTVNYSNHAGYGRAGGTKTTAAELDNMLEVLEQNELLMPTRLLTGYIPGADALSAVFRIAKKLKEEKSNIIYLLDPVMGDAGKLYVAADVVPVYREMLPLATVITPNWFEVEVLTQVEIKDIPSLQLALLILHTEYQVPNIVISSMPLRPWLSEALPPSIFPPISNEDSEYLFCIASSTSFHSRVNGDTSSNPSKPNGINGTHPCPSTIHAACVPLIPGYFSGVGDLFSAFLLAHFHPNAPADPCFQPSPTDSVVKAPLQTALSHAASLALTKTHAVLAKTHEYSLTLPPEEQQSSDSELDEQDPMRRIRRMRGRELALVQSQDIIRGIGITKESVRWMRSWDGLWDI